MHAGPRRDIEVVAGGMVAGGALREVLLTKETVGEVGALSDYLICGVRTGARRYGSEQDANSSGGVEELVLEGVALSADLVVMLAEEAGRSFEARCDLLTLSVCSVAVGDVGSQDAGIAVGVQEHVVERFAGCAQSVVCLAFQAVSRVNTGSDFLREQVGTIAIRDLLDKQT